MRCLAGQNAKHVPPIAVYTPTVKKAPVVFGYLRLRRNCLDSGIEVEFHLVVPKPRWRERLQVKANRRVWEVYSVAEAIAGIPRVGTTSAHRSLETGMNLKNEFERICRDLALFLRVQMRTHHSTWRVFPCHYVFCR